MSDIDPQHRSYGGHTVDLRGMCVGAGCSVPSRRMAEVMWQGSLEENIGQPFLAHYGELNEKERLEFLAEVERMWGAHKAA